MVIEHEAFTRTRLDEDRALDKSKVIPVRLNKEELERLEEDARFMGQEKASTALKQLAEVGHIVLHDPQTRAILEFLFNNERRNKRLGIGQADPKFSQL